MKGGPVAPEISVLIAAYNCAEWIAAALDSVLTQDIGPIEILVVDDASSDATATIIESYGERGVRLIRQPENRGPASCRNLALGQAQGCWIAILDADDRFAPDRLRRLLQLASETGADVVADGQRQILADSGREVGLRFSQMPDSALTAPGLQLQEYLQQIELGILKPLFRREFLLSHAIRYREELLRGEDFLFLLQCLRAGARVRLTPDPLYLATLRSGSLTADRLAMQSSMVHIFDELLADTSLAASPCGPQLRQARERARASVRYARVADPFKKGRIGQALAQLLRTPEFPWLWLRRLPTMLRFRLTGRLGNRSPGDEDRRN